MVPLSGPARGSKLVMTGFRTVNIEPAVTGLETEFTVTVTGPVPFGVEMGTAAIICVLLQLVMDVANAPLKVTVLEPWVVPKFDPAMVTAVPIVPMIGATPETKGVVPTVTATLSKETVSRDQYPLTARPIYTV